MEDVTMPFIFDRMLNKNQLAIEDPYYYQNKLEIEDPSYGQPQDIEEPRSDGFKKPPKQKTFTVDIFKGIDEQVINKYGIPIKYDNKDQIENALENIIKPKIKDITKRKKANNKWK